MISVVKNQYGVHEGLREQEVDQIRVPLLTHRWQVTKIQAALGNYLDTPQHQPSLCYLPGQYP